MKFKIFLLFFVFLLLPIYVNSTNITSTGVFATVEYAKSASYSYPDRIEYFNFNNFYMDYSDISTRQLKYDLIHGINKDSVLIITKSRGVLSSKLCEDSLRNDGTNTCSFTYDDALISQDYLYAYVCTPDLDYCSSKTFKLLLRNDSEKIESGVYLKSVNAKSSSYSYPKRVEYFSFDNFTLNFSDIGTRGMKYDVEHNMNVDRNSTLIITKTRGVLSSKLCQDSLRFDGTNTCSFNYTDVLIRQDYLYAYLCTDDLDYCRAKTFKFLMRNISEKIESGVYFKSVNAKNSTYSYPKRVEYFNFDNFILNFSDISTKGLKYDVVHNMNIDRNSTLIITKTRGVYSSKLCEDSLKFDGTNTCSFTYDDTLIRQDYLYAYLCTPDLDYCRAKTFKFLLRNESEKIETGVYALFNMNNSNASDPMYIIPTPLNNSVYGYKNMFTIKIIGNDDTFESCKLNVNGTNYSMNLVGNDCSFDISISKVNYTQSFNFQAYYNVSGSENSLEKRFFSVNKYVAPKEKPRFLFPANGNISGIIAILMCMFYFIIG